MNNEEYPSPLAEARAIRWRFTSCPWRGGGACPDGGFHRSGRPESGAADIFLLKGVDHIEDREHRLSASRAEHQHAGRSAGAPHRVERLAAAPPGLNPPASGVARVAQQLG